LRVRLNEKDTHLNTLVVAAAEVARPAAGPLLKETSG